MKLNRLSLTLKFTKAIAPLITVGLSISIALSPGARAWSDNDIAVTVIGDQVGGTYDQEGLSIAVDSSGNTYTSGSFQGIAIFGLGDGATTLNSNGGRDAFVAKHDSSGNLLWVKSFGGSLTDQVKDVAVDRNGNVVMAGEFYGTVDFDPGSGEDSFTALANSGPNPQWNWLGAVLWKLDSDGNYLWAKSFDGLLFDTGVSVAVDGNGNIAFTGVVMGSVDLDPSPQKIEDPSPIGGDGDTFVSTFTSSGELIWGKRFGSLGYDVGQSVAFDNSGAVYVSGSFQRTADFDPGAGVESLTAVGSGSSPSDMYISKFNVSDGAFEWVRQYKGYGANDGPALVSVDSNNFVYVSGDFNGELTLYTNQNKEDTFSVTSVGTRDNFISKWAPTGSHVWTKQIGSSDGAAYGATTAIDVYGNIFYTGYETGTVDFNPGTESFTLSSSSLVYKDIFISKLNSSGEFLWARSMGSSSADDCGLAIAADVSGNVYSTGFFQGTADLDPTIGERNFLSAGGKDIFISKLNPNGLPFINVMVPTPGEIAAQVTARNAVVVAEAAAAKAAAAKREADRSSARKEIATSVKSAKDLTVDSFARAEIPGITVSNIDAVKAELLALPEESRNDFNQVLKVARKFEVVGNIASDQVKNIQPSAFVEIGLIPGTSKNKVALANAVKKLPTAARDSYIEIKAAIEAANAVIQKRADRLAKVLGGKSVRTKK